MSDPYAAYGVPADPYAQYGAPVSEPAPKAAAKSVTNMTDYLGNFRDSLPDWFRSIPSGLLHGVTGAADLPSYLVGGPIPGVPTASQMINKVISKPFGGEYTPKTKAGEYAQSIASFAPAAVTGPEGVLPKIASVVGPGVGSQLGHDLTKGTRFEPLGSLVGSLLGGAVTGVRINPASPKEAVPTTSDLKQAAQDAYKASEDAGVMISPDSIKSMVDKTRETLANEGVHPVLHRNAMAALDSLQEAADKNLPITLKGMDTLRQVAGDAVSNSMMAPADKRLSYIVKNNIDDFVNNLEPSDLVGTPDAPSAVASLKTARTLWSKASKADIIQKRIDRAATRASQYSQAGGENALRVEFRQLAMNEKAMSRFTPAEQDAIRSVSKGAPVTNIMRHLGKFSPQGPVSTALGAGTGFLAGGPPGALALPALGASAKFVATKLTQKAAMDALRQMQRGAPAPTQPLITYTNPYPGLFGSAAQQSMVPSP